MVQNQEEKDEGEAKDTLLDNHEADKEITTATDDAKDDDNEVDKDVNTDTYDAKIVDNEGVPTDSGFAWVIVSSVFIIMTVIIGFNRSLSVLFVDISEEFQEKATIVSLMFTLHSLASSVSSIIVSNIIMSKVTVRNICIVAAIVNSLISIALSLAPNIVVFLLLFVCKGAFFGALLVAPMSLIGFYFKKRRSLASSVATAGMCVAFIVFPPITETLRVEYGMRGSFLVLAAIELHVVACSLLLRPVESYKAIYKSKMESQRKEEEMRQLFPIYKGTASDTAMSAVITSQVGQQAGDNVRENRNLECEISGADTLSDVNDDLDRQLLGSDTCYNSVKRDDSMSVNIKYTTNCSQNIFSSLNDVDMSSPLSKDGVERSRQVRKKNIIFERQASHLSAISLTELTYIAPECLQVANKECENEDGKSKSLKQTLCLRLVNTFIDVSLFKIWRFRMMTAFIPLSVFANYTIIYMPVICKTLDINTSDAALLMTLCGIMDLVTRIFTGFIGDFKFVSIPKLVVFSTFVVGTVCHCTRFFTSHALFIVYAVLVGVFGGIRQNFFSVMVLEYVGVQNMAKAYGIASTLGTLSLSVNHPIVAALFDATKDFVIPMHYVGVMVNLGTLILMLEPVFLKLDRKNVAIL